MFTRGYTLSKLINVNKSTIKHLLPSNIYNRLKVLEINKLHPTHRGTKGFWKSCVHIPVRINSMHQSTNIYTEGVNLRNLLYINTVDVSRSKKETLSVSSSSHVSAGVVMPDLSAIKQRVSVS